jgi:Tol biopolymer transport system component
MIGRTIAHYQLTDKLGAGGMGEVYLAHDTKLDRKVALKILPADVADHPDRMKRFVQEAKAASALNHPNIITIYEIDESDSGLFIATEFIDGETLGARELRAPLKLGESVDIATQIASALAAAHAAGIVHRDIKPDNVMLRHDGIVKVLDFGLAKLTDRTSPEAVEKEALTRANIKTEPGVVMGTVIYMSPEQARGLPVDARTDIFSLGVVIYEMLAGRNPFQGATPSDVIAAILKTEPPLLSHCLPDVPRELEHLVGKALRKDREARYQGIKDLLIDLKDLKQDMEMEARLEQRAYPLGALSGATASRSGQVNVMQSGTAHQAWWSGWSAKAALALGGIVVLTAAWFLLSRFRGGAGETPATLRSAAFAQLTDQAGQELFPSLSPDGKSFVYVRDGDIYFQRVGGKNLLNLTKDSPAADTQPAFSPDGEHIAFRSERDGGGIFVIGATGESVKRLTDFGYNPVWSPDGQEILCATLGIVQPAGRSAIFSQLWSVNVATGERRLVTKGDAVQPNWSPNGSRIAYWGLHQGGWRDIWTIPARGGEPVAVTNDAAVDWNPVWSPDGKHLYLASDRGGSMNFWRVPIEEASGKVLGPPEPVTTPSSYSEHLSFSRDGRRMAYVQTISSANLQQVGFDPARETLVGGPVPITQGSRQATAPNLSPDGEWLTFGFQGEKQEDLYVIRRGGTGLRQLTDDIYKDRTPRWSPDGKRIAFYSDRSGRYEIWLISPDGSRLEQLTYTSGQSPIYPVWSPDGTRLAYSIEGSGAFILEIGKPWKEQSPQALPPMSDPPGRFTAWSWSPDGQRLAGWRQRTEGAPPASNIVLYSFVSQQYEQLTDVGNGPIWLSDSRRLLFLRQGHLWLADSQSKKFHEILSVAPHNIASLGLSRDNRLICFSLSATEADIWLMTLE